MRGLRFPMLLLAATAAGAFVAYGFQARAEPDPAPEVVPEEVVAGPAAPSSPTRTATLPTDAFVVGESYYLQVLRRGGLAIDVMSPLVLTPFASDQLAEGVPDT